MFQSIRRPVVLVNARSSDSIARLNKIKKNITEFNYEYKKHKVHLKLDRQLERTLSTCGSNTEDFHCKLLWKSLYDILVELNDINEAYISLKREYEDAYDEESNLEDDFL